MTGRTAHGVFLLAAVSLWIVVGPATALAGEKTHDLRGTVLAYATVDGARCGRAGSASEDGLGVTSDVDAGDRVIVRNSKGKRIAVSNLTLGTYEEESGSSLKPACEFPFRIRELESSRFYRFTVEDSGAPAFNATRAHLAGDRWRVEIDIRGLGNDRVCVAGACEPL